MIMVDKSDQLPVQKFESPMSDVCYPMSDVRSPKHQSKDKKVGPDHVVSDINGQGCTRLEK